MKYLPPAVRLVAVFGAGTLFAGCGSQDSRTVSFSQDITPILNEYCVECHTEGGRGLRRSGLRLDSYDALMAGTVITPGDTSKSPLLVYIHPSADPATQMPYGQARRLTSTQVELVSAWIAQGARNN